MAWWQDVAWHEWLNEIGAVERPTEDAVMKRLALQTHTAQAFFNELRYDLEYEAALRHVLHEAGQARHEMSLRELHQSRGVELRWIDLHDGGAMEAIEVAVET